MGAGGAAALAGLRRWHDGIRQGGADVSFRIKAEVTEELSNGPMM
jgi:hypothetical protein